MGNSKSAIKLDETLQDITVQTFLESYEKNKIIDKDLFVQPVFSKKIEKTIQTLINLERYEDVFPLSRLVIPMLEEEENFDALRRIYAQLEIACTKAAETKKDSKQHYKTYYRVVFYGKEHFGEKNKTEWIFRENGLISLAEACERMKDYARRLVGHNNVAILSEKEIDKKNLDPSIAYVQMTHVEPYLGDGQSFNSDGSDDFSAYYAQAYIKKFFYEEAIVDESVPKSAPEWARLSLKKVFLKVEKPLSNTRSRQQVVKRFEKTLNPLELACESLHLKAAQIRKILDAAGIKRGQALDKKMAHKNLDLKGLQLVLQGSVSPSVNVGPLVYAEAFTEPLQRDRYGPVGISKLVMAFKDLMTEISEALRVNEAVIGKDQLEYHKMLKGSYETMSHQLRAFFNFILEFEDWPNSAVRETLPPINHLRRSSTISNSPAKPEKQSLVTPLREYPARQSRATGKRSGLRFKNDALRRDIPNMVTPRRAMTPGPIRLVFDSPENNSVLRTVSGGMRQYPSYIGSMRQKSTNPSEKFRFEHDSPEQSRPLQTQHENQHLHDGIIRQKSNGYRVYMSPRSKTHGPAIRYNQVPETNIENINPRSPKSETRGY